MARRRFTLYHGLAVSLALHACLALPFVAAKRYRPEQKPRHKLVIELFGMVADRQTEERVKGAEATRQSRPAPPRTSPPRRESPSGRTERADDAVPVVREPERPEPAETETAPAVAAPPMMAGAAERQRQQTIRSAQELEAAAIRAYLARLARHLRRNLVYPEEVRRSGVVGVTTVSFRITGSGQFVEQSLKVQKSSGYPALDGNALKTVRISAPFETPPKELTVSIAMSFSIRN